MKKVVFIIYSSLFINAGSNLSAKIIPLNLSKPPSVSLKQANSTQGQISRLLAAKLESNISKVYGQHQRRQIYDEVLKIIQATLRDRPANLRIKDLNSPSTWYTNEITYMFYAENFGTRQPGKTNNLHDLLAMIPYLSNLGVTNVYILPFVESPLKDGGFDVKNPLMIRPTLGTLNDFQQVVKLLHQNGIKVTADLVLNHLSDQSQWFQQALKGNQQKIDYFLYKNYLPRYIKYFDPRRGVVIDYTNKDGVISSRRLIFPELTPNHYRKEVINHKNYYFYHTFYPFQIDLNWKNPQVLYEMLRVVGFWCNQGIDIFRLDSIPFLVKTEGTTGENLPETHEIISLISTFLQASCPSSVLQAEAGQSPKAILPYFGKEYHYQYTDLGRTKTIRRTDQVQIAYNFPLMPALWASMILGKNTYFWDTFQAIKATPNSASWATFLRLHDELTLETAKPSVRKQLYNTLKVNGIGFRGGLGVGGRMANFLDNDQRRITQAFALLMSLPGSPIIYYGDEIGADNNWSYAKIKALARKEGQTSTKPDFTIQSYFDSRDINRGPISYQNFYQAIAKPNSFSGKIYHSLKHEIAVRKAHLSLSKGQLQQVLNARPDVLTYIRKYNQEAILVVNNLSNKNLTTAIKIPRDFYTTSYAARKSYTTVYPAKILDLLSDQVIHLSQNKEKIVLRLAPYQSLWLTPKSAFNKKS